MRSGIEATNSEFKRRYGGGRLRMGGSPAVKRVVHLKFMALNISRWLAAETRRSEAMTRRVDGVRKAARQAA